MSAIFLAVVVYLSYSYLNIPVKLSFVASGFLGYTGVDSIDMLRRAVMYKKFGLKAEDYETQETKEEVKARG
jgi:hypothetical protein